MTFLYPQNTRSRTTLLVTAFLSLWLFSTVGKAGETQPGKPDAISLTLIPPACVTDQVTLDIRGALRNEADSSKEFEAAFYLDEVEPGTLLYREKLQILGHSSGGIRFRWPTKGHAGRHRVFLVATSGQVTHSTDRPIEIRNSKTRSSKRIEGAWLTLLPSLASYGQNTDLHKMTDAQWQEMVRNMHEIGMDVIVITEVWRQCSGKMLYPSRLAPLDTMTAKDPVEVVLTEADRLDMYVFLGDKIQSGPPIMRPALADELWERYGHHRSFYGWYLQEALATHMHQYIDQFREIQTHCRKLAPDKPVMYAPSLEFVPDAHIAQSFPKILKYCDIITLFGFPRHIDVKKTTKANVQRSISEFQKVCDDAHAHLWWDVETFFFDSKGEFGPKGNLSTQNIHRVLEELQEYTSFEKVICYRYSGLIASPEASIQPGGPAAVRFYQDYRRYIEQGPPKRNSQTTTPTAPSRP